MENYIINGLVEKNEEILGLFIDEYGKLLYSVVKSVLPYPNERGYVEECVDDVILLVWKNIDLYDHQGKFKAWLVSIARFKALDYKRKYKKLSLNDSLEDNTHYANSGIEEKLIQEEKFSSLNKALDILNDTDKIIIKLKYFEGCSAEEISKIIGFSPAFIYNRLSRAKKKLLVHNYDEMRDLYV